MDARHVPARENSSSSSFSFRGLRLIFRRPFSALVCSIARPIFLPWVHHPFHFPPTETPLSKFNIHLRENRSTVWTVWNNSSRIRSAQIRWSQHCATVQFAVRSFWLDGNTRLSLSLFLWNSDTSWNYVDYIQDVPFQELSQGVHVSAPFEACGIFTPQFFPPAGLKTSEMVDREREVKTYFCDKIPPAFSRSPSTVSLWRFIGIT